MRKFSGLESAFDSPDPLDVLATRHNEGKPKWALLHYPSLVPMIRILEWGASNYGAFNWQKGFIRSELLESMQRHLAALMDGEENDSQTKMSHAAHLMTNCMFYIFHFVIKNGNEKKSN